ncbi:MAG: VTT domain-containing protein [Blastocatellia bacterium]|nr:VTT domain-containing protein [Blastocatellia bacterium]
MIYRLYTASFFLLKFLDTLSKTLLDYGWIGLFAIALLDSTFVPVPSGPDVLLIGLSIGSTLSNIIICMVAATVGSTLGCSILYLASKNAGVRALKRISPEKREYVKDMLGRYDLLAVIGASLMPPPFPFKPFIICAGVFNFDLKRLIAGLLIGRSARFIILGLLSLYFGQATIELVKRHGWKVLVVIIILGGLAYLIKYFSSRKKANQKS